MHCLPPCHTSHNEETMQGFRQQHLIAQRELIANQSFCTSPHPATGVLQLSQDRVVSRLVGRLWVSSHICTVHMATTLQYSIGRVHSPMLYSTRIQLCRSNARGLLTTSSPDCRVHTSRHTTQCTLQSLT